MKDKKDHATLDLPGFGQPGIAGGIDAASAAADTLAARRTSRPRPSISRPPQEQLQLLAPTDASGLPLWQRDQGLDLSGLPVWAAA